MARNRMTLEQIRATRPTIDSARLASTAEDDIARHRIEDGEGPDDHLADFEWVPNVKAIRTKLKMTQEFFAATIGVPVATIRNWEQSRTRMDPAARALLRVLQREPDAALRALAK